MRIALLVPAAILLATSSLEAQSGSSATATGNVRGGLGAPPDAAPPANRLSGIYLGFRLPGFGPGSVAVGSVEAYAFYPDGAAMYLPVGGLEGYDLTQAAAGGLDPLTYGTYVYGDGKVRFTSRNGAAREISIDPIGSGPGLDYVRACHCNGARFAGTYYYGLKAQTITFSADGRFVDQGAMHDAFQFSYPNNQRATAPGAGTYQVQDYTIHLNYSDGRQFRYSFVVASHPPKTPEAMWIRGVSFHPAPGSISNTSSAEPDGSQMLANGNPPLTELIARDFGAFFTWVLGVTLTDQQNQVIGQYLVASWAKDPPGEIKSKLQIVNLYRDLMLTSSDQQEEARQKLQPQILQSLQAQPDVAAQMLITAYRAQHGPR